MDAEVGVGGIVGSTCASGRAGWFRDRQTHP